jgi:glutathione S-transferase
MLQQGNIDICAYVVSQYESGAILLYLQNKYVQPLGTEQLGKLAQWIFICYSTMVCFTERPLHLFFQFPWCCERKAPSLLIAGRDSVVEIVFVGFVFVG